ncbi:MAG: hypothetical protein WBI00_16250 [Thermoanaerobaculia bacterium]
MIASSVTRQSWALFAADGEARLDFWSCALHSPAVRRFIKRYMNSTLS